MADQTNVAFVSAGSHPPNATPASNPLVGRMIGSQATSKPWPQPNFAQEVHAAAVRAGTNFGGR
jgi:hypothetical protein